MGEIAEASKEQSTGIEQVNIAITEMDRVVQQNAAYAEESASAAEQLNSQAANLKDYANDLVAMVSGTARVRGAGVSGNDGRPRKSAVKRVGSSPTGREEIKPDQVLALEDESEYRDF